MLHKRREIKRIALPLQISDSSARALGNFAIDSWERSRKDRARQVNFCKVGH